MQPGCTNCRLPKRRCVFSLVYPRASRSQRADTRHTVRSRDTALSMKPGSFTHETSAPATTRTRVVRVQLANKTARKCIVSARLLAELRASLPCRPRGDGPHKVLEGVGVHSSRPASGETPLDICDLLADGKDQMLSGINA